MLRHHTTVRLALCSWAAGAACFAPTDNAADTAQPTSRAHGRPGDGRRAGLGARGALEHLLCARWRGVPPGGGDERGRRPGRRHPRTRGPPAGLRPPLRRPEGRDLRGDLRAPHHRARARAPVGRRPRGLPRRARLPRGPRGAARRLHGRDHRGLPPRSVGVGRGPPRSSPRHQRLPLGPGRRCVDRGAVGAARRRPVAAPRCHHVSGGRRRPPRLRLDPRRLPNHGDLRRGRRGGRRGRSAAQAATSSW